MSKSPADSTRVFIDEERQTHLCKVWREKILPKWEQKKHSRKLRDLVFEGIPPSVRGEAWKRIIGNSLKVTPELYSILCEQADKSRKDFEKLSGAIADADGDVGGSGGTVEQLYSRERSAQKSINLDLPRTFPELAFFHVESSPLQAQLRELLEAYVCFRPDIGYTQGMSYLAAGLLLYMDGCDAFISFCNLLHRSCFIAFFSMKMPDVQIYLQTHQRLFKSELPALYEHFDKIRIEPEMYMSFAFGMDLYWMEMHIFFELLWAFLNTLKTRY
ncbi:TBC1 domain family member 12 [Galdieria sulphuraria]|nr:TBC1 domain family member 12 [Galdieria sulphuraria]